MVTGVSGSGKSSLVTDTLAPALTNAVHRSKRPVLADKTDEELRGFIARSLEGRMPFYSRARHTFPAARLESRTEIAESVDLFRRQLGL